jgi:DNA-binding NtrC family response regulator
MKKSVYIVEDDMFYATILNEELKRSGITDTKLFYDAKSFFKHINEAPDIVLLDHKLGEENGIDVLKKIKSYNPNIEVVFLSGQEDLSVAVNALKFGAYDYVEKNANAFPRVKRLVVRIRKLRQIIKENKELQRAKNIAITSVAALLGVLIFLNFKYPRVFDGL